ncbi:hypothetical protein [Actinomadura kijaniata]|uniref:hypothetical protein n=1 Tax=Actinomadura kijaniata TaxID=46161 RepID=UPI00083376D3|nr:hypothetical protein [Actinomadura kijaniata]
MDEATTAAARAGKERDGSGVGALHVTTAHWDRDAAGTTVRPGASQAPMIADSLRGRLPYGRALVVRAGATVVVFRPAAELTVERSDDSALLVGVPVAALDALLAALVRRAGVARSCRGRGWRSSARACFKVGLSRARERVT